jgi:pSer/pThr/pTyr-binding forkhead associated (FHA) protein
MYLKVEIEDTQSLTYSLPKSSISIGAASGNNVIINVNSVSRSHLKLIKEGQSWFVEDQGSTNGSYLNGRKISSGSKELLRPNEFVRLGDKVFIMLVSSAEKPQAIANYKERKSEDEKQDKTRVISLKEIREAAEIEKRRKELLAERKIRTAKHFDGRKVAMFIGSVTVLALMRYFV